MKLILRLAFRLLVGTVGILLMVWLLVWGYVILNKKSIIRQVNALVSSKVKGEINIGDLEPSLLSTFPYVSLRLSRVLVRDTLWQQHHHDLLKADNIFIRLSFFSLFSGSPQVNKVIMEKGAIYLFSDRTGYSNQYMFTAKREAVGSGKEPATFIPDVEVRNVDIVLDLFDRNKLFHFSVHHLTCNTSNQQALMQLDVKTDVTVHRLAFNTNNGSFATEKPLEGKFRLHFDRLKKQLSFKNVLIRIDDQPFVFTGMFNLADAPPLYHLTLSAHNLLYKTAAALLSANISRKLDTFNIEKPFDVVAILDGNTHPNKTPRVSITATIKDNTISTPAAVFTHASFRADFSNQLNLNEPRADQNSGFAFTGVRANWEDIVLHADSIGVTDLKHPVLHCDLRSSFKMQNLNELLGSNSIAFTKGNCQVNVTYRGVIKAFDTASASIYGNIQMQDAAIQYLPRNLAFTGCSGKIAFADKDVYIRQFKAQSGSTQLLMNGAVKNLVSLIDKNPEKLILNWNIASPKLNLGDFIGFLGKRSVAVSKNAKRKFLKLAGRIDRMLEDCNVDLQVKASRLLYKKFEAANVAATLQLTNNLVALKNVSVEHAGGTLLMNGSLKENVAGNALSINTNLNNVDVTKVFTAFNNFGQDGITDKNIRGRLTAAVNVTGLITNKANMVKNSLKGIVLISLKDGALIDFEPVQKISKTAFKNRDFSNIRFAELKEKLEVDGSQIKVNRMEIQSTVLTMFVEGMYDVEKGTDLSIQIPLSNLSKRGEDFELKNKGVKSKTGVSLRLRAKTGDDGKAKISWDPFNRALKNREKASADSTVVQPPGSTQKKAKQQ